MKWAHEYDSRLLLQDEQDEQGSQDFSDLLIMPILLIL